MVRKETIEKPNCFRIVSLLAHTDLLRLNIPLSKPDITHRVIDRGEFHQQKIEKTLSEALNVEVVSDCVLHAIDSSCK